MKILIGLIIVLSGAFISKVISYDNLNTNNESLKAELDKVYHQIDNIEIYHQDMLERQKEFSLVEGCYRTIKVLCDKYLGGKSVKCRNELNQACQEVGY